jgi:PqqD family protein of HPr-rel-A system
MKIIQASMTSRHHMQFISEHNPAWAVVPGLSLSTWPDEDEAIVYLSETGDVHWLSGTARAVMECLQRQDSMSEAELYQSLSAVAAYDKHDLSEHCIPYLRSLGLICQVSL